MKNQKKMVVEMIAKNIKNNLSTRIGQLFLFFVLFLAGSANAQITVQSYPATNLGQSLLITSSDPDFTDMMTASATVRATYQTELNSCTSCTPDQVEACVGNVCCDSDVVSIGGQLKMVTVCSTEDTHKWLCTIIQPY